VLNVINSTISGNTANGSGGGIYASNNASTSVTIQNSTIAYNHASIGGGIRTTNGTYSLTNTILANNTGSTSNPDCSGTIAAAYFNIIETMSGCSISVGSNNLNADPQLSNKLSGVMLVHALLAGSPAINAGTASGCPATDQRGLTRPQESQCDVGSYEYQDFQPPQVSSITRVDTFPTSAASVNFIVAFSEAVTGVNANLPFADFALTTTGVTGASITGVSGSGATRTVTVNTGSGSGTIRLDVVDDDSIQDGSSNPLGGVGAGSYTGGEVYTITKGFYINGRYLLDANGNNFVMRGINHPHNWYPDETGSLADIKARGANTVRVVLSSGKLWPKNSTADVANVINLCKASKLICVLEVHDTTGYGEDAEAASLAEAVIYWKEIKSVLIGQEAYVIINLGNEPYGKSMQPAGCGQNASPNAQRGLPYAHGRHPTGVRMAIRHAR
jgi:hypothetical protein